MSTPEGKIKALVTKLLKAQANIYWFMPVQNGMGRATLDYVGWHHGLPFAVETKAPGKKPTARQELTIREMVAAGARVFVIDGDEGLRELEEWLKT